MDNANKCCGKNRETVFCCDCGRKIKDDSSIWALVSHCRLVSENASKSAIGFAKNINKERWSANSIAAKRRAVKWSEWADQLTALIESNK